MKPVCPYCSREAELVDGTFIYPHRPDLQAKKFWLCQPCWAYVGCHAPNIGYGDGTRPLGRLADASLRSAKQRAHEVFDHLWTRQKNRAQARKRAYAELAKRMGIKVEDCHIGMFDVAQCNQARDHALNMLFQQKRGMK